MKQTARKTRSATCLIKPERAEIVIKKGRRSENQPRSTRSWRDSITRSHHKVEENDLNGKIQIAKVEEEKGMK